MEESQNALNKERKKMNELKIAEQKKKTKEIYNLFITVKTPKNIIRDRALS